MTNTSSERQSPGAAAAEQGGILVTGATGKIGRRVTARLTAAGLAPRAAARRGTTRLDWQDRATWKPALDGAHTLFLALPEDEEDTVPVGDFTAAAVASGISRIVLLSGRGADSFEGAAPIEEAVRSSGAAWSLLRPNNFAQNFGEGAFRAAIMAGELALPIGEVPEPFIDAEDIADVAAVLLAEDGHAGRAYDLSGPEALTWAEAAAVIGRALGRTIRFTDVAPEDYEKAETIGPMFATLRTGVIAEPAGGVREVLGRDPVPFGSYVGRAAAAGAWT